MLPTPIFPIFFAMELALAIQVPMECLYFFLKAPVVGSDLLLAYVTFLALSNQKHYYFFF